MAVDIDSIISGMRAAPGLDPAALTAIASTSATPGDVVNNAQATQGFSDISRQAENWKVQPDDMQRQYWSQATDQEKEMLGAAGYKPPHKGFGSLGGRIFHDLTHNMFTDQALAPAKLAMQGLAMGRNAVTHSDRMIQSLKEQQLQINTPGTTNTHPEFGDIPSVLKREFNVSRWAQAWRETSNGENTFSPIQVNRIKQKYGEEVSDKAQKLVSGYSKEDLLRSTPTQDQQRIAALFDNPQFINAQHEMKDAQMSVGRSVASTFGLSPGSGAFKAVSGFYDGMDGLFRDPLIVAGKAKEGYNAIKYVVKSAEDVYRLADSAPKFQRAVADIYNVTKESGAAGLLAKHPEMEPFAEDIASRVKNNPNGAKGIVDFFAEKADAAHVLQGGGLNTNPATNIIGKQVPTLSWAEDRALDAKGALKKSIDWAADARSNPKASGIQQLLRPIYGSPLKKVSTLVTSVGEISPDDPRAITQIQRLARTFLPANLENDVVNHWAEAAGDIGTRRNILLSLEDSVMRHAGIEDPVRETLMGRFRDAYAPKVGTATEAFSGKSYGSGDTSIMQTEGHSTANALYEGQVDDVKWSLPNYRTLAANAQRVGAFKTLRAMATSEQADFLMNNWKPTVLLRLGFPVRAGGDEWVLNAIRQGLVGALRAGIGKSAVKGAERQAALDSAKGDVDQLSASLQDAQEALAKKDYGSVLPSQSFNNDLDAAKAAQGHVESLQKSLTNATDHLSSLPGDQVLPVHPVGTSIDWLTSHLPEKVQATLGHQTAADVYANVVGEWTRRQFRNVESRLGGDQYVNATKDLYKYGNGEAGLSDMISGVHNRTMGYIETPQGVKGVVKNGDAMRPHRLVPVGDEYRNYSSDDPEQMAAWLRRIHEIGGSLHGKAAIEGLGKKELPDHINSVADVLDSAEFAADRAKFARNNSLSDGRVVGINGTTARDASTDWASKVIQDAHNMFTGGDGTVLEDLRDKALRAPTKITYDDLKNIPLESRPLHVNGPVYRQVPINKWQNFLDKGFEQVVGRPMDWISRQPIFVHAYAKAQNELTPLRSYLTDQLEMSPEEVGKIMYEHSRGRALDEVTPFIHDVHARSQFSENMRNLLPFQFAQEQFIKRWTKTLIDNPAEVRQAQLLLHGFTHSGFVHKDDQGNDYFMYPGSQYLQNVLSPMVSSFLGSPGTVPVPVGFSGELRFMSAGAEHMTSLAPGPLFSIPMNLLASRFPELEPVAQKTLGERGAGRPFWEQITPPTVARLVHVLVDDPNKSPQMASAMVQAMMYMKSTNQAPPEDADAGTQEDFNRRLVTFARTVMLNRAMFGFVAPASPEVQLDPKHLTEEYRKLLGGGMSPADALKTFVAAHPHEDVSPYTVFQSESQSGAPLPATAETAKFMANNEDFLKNYPMAAGWFVPQMPADRAQFSQAAYREQLGLELRKRKTFDQIKNDIYHAEAATQFYEAKDARDAQLAQAKHTPMTQTINHNWSEWSQQFLNTHPIFAQEYQSNDGAYKRQEALREIGKAFQDQRLPKTDQIAALKTLTDQYANYRAQTQAISGFTTGAYSSMRKQMRTNFVTNTKAYVLEHPELEGFYNKVMRPDVEGGIGSQ